MTTPVTGTARMPEGEYHAHHALSASMAKVLVKPGGPAKLRWQLDHPRVEKKEFDLGSAAHALVLGVGQPIRVIPADLLARNGAASTGEAKAFIAEARADGATPLKAAEAEQVIAMAEQIRRSPEAMAALHADGAQHELSAFHVDEQTGVPLRCRFDVIAPTIICDYKTAADGEPGRFARRVMLDNGLHIQAGHYSDMGAAVGLTSPDTPFRFVVQEKVEPFLVSVVTVSEDYLALGRQQMRRAIDLWAQCLRTDTWPGYPATTAEPPLWAYIDDTPTALNPDTEAELIALIGAQP